MRKRVLQAALRIALIREEFSDEEIREAVELLEGSGDTIGLLSFLSGKEKRQETRQSTKSKDNIALEHRSKTVLALENTEPEKYRLLSDFESSLHRNRLLPSIGELRGLGERLSKGFSGRSSRKDLINKLLDFLVTRSVEDIRETIKLAESLSISKDSEYQQLATFIIGGGKKETPE